MLYGVFLRPAGKASWQLVWDEKGPTGQPGFKGSPEWKFVKERVGGVTAALCSVLLFFMVFFLDSFPEVLQLLFLCFSACPKSLVLSLPPSSGFTWYKQDS